MARIKGEIIERLSDKADKHDQHRLYLGRFDVEKVRLVIKNALCRSSELCFLPGRGAHLQKNYEKRIPESRKSSLNNLDGKCDGYMRAVGGSEERKC